MLCYYIDIFFINFGNVVSYKSDPIIQQNLIYFHYQYTNALPQKCLFLLNILNKHYNLRQPYFHHGIWQT